MNLPMLGNLVWMNASEDQQMVVFGQVMERLDRCPEAFVLVEETKDSDQHRSRAGELLQVFNARRSGLAGEDRTDCALVEPSLQGQGSSRQFLPGHKICQQK